MPFYLDPDRPHWQRLWIAAWQRLAGPVEAAWEALTGRVQESCTVELEIVSTEGWSEAEKRAFIEEALRRREEGRRARRCARRPEGDDA